MVNDSVEWSRFNDSRRVRVAGLDFHRGNVARLVRRVPDVDEWRFEGEGTLVRESSNPHDPNAVKVLVDGHHVGYLPKGTAKRLAKRLDAGDSDETYPAFVAGRLSRLYAHLQVPYDSELLKGYKNTKRKR